MAVLCVISKQQFLKEDVKENVYRVYDKDLSRTGKKFSV